MDLYSIQLQRISLPSEGTVNTVRCVTCIASGSLFGDCVRPINILHEIL